MHSLQCYRVTRLLEMKINDETWALPQKSAHERFLMPLRQ